MFKLPHGLPDEDEPLDEFGLPSRPSYVSTPYGVGRMRWTPSATAWVKGEGFDAPLSHVGSSTLKVAEGPPPFEAGRPAGRGLPAGVRAVDPAELDRPSPQRPDLTGMTAEQMVTTMDAYKKRLNPGSKDVYALERPYAPNRDGRWSRYPRVHKNDFELDIISTIPLEDAIQGQAEGTINREQYEAAQRDDLPEPYERILGLAGTGITIVRNRVGEDKAFEAWVNKHWPAGHPARGWPGEPDILDMPETYDPARNRMIIAVDGPYHDEQNPRYGGAKRQGSANMNWHVKFHAIDRIFGNLHSTPEFIAAWDKDNAAFSDWRPSRYYSLKGDNGTQQTLDGALEETFAESGLLYQTDPGELERRAPNLYRYWQQFDERLKRGVLPNQSYRPDGRPR